MWFLASLGLADGRCENLVERLLHWQWPDGGWNCDRDPGADTSSFFETLLPMRGLWVHGAPQARCAALDAAEVLLERRLAYRASTGALIRAEFTKLHYPLYWHYDILGGLNGMMELCSATRVAPTPSTCSSRCGSPTAGRPTPGSIAHRVAPDRITTSSIGVAQARDGQTSGSPPTP